MAGWVRLLSTALIVVALALPFLPVGTYTLHVANLIAINAILAMSLDLLFGYLGQMSLAHAGFYGIGAYAAALLTSKGILPFWVATPAAMGICAVVGVFIGVPAMRLTGFYLAMATMALGIILSTLFVQSVGITGGPNGLLGIAPPEFFGTELLGPVRGFSGNYYFLLLLSAGLVWLLLRRLTTGRSGRTIVGIRESPLAAASLGIDVRAVQVAVFALSGALAGLAGSLYAHLILYISPETFTFANSLVTLLAVVFGGIGTLWGPIVGAGMLTVLSEQLHAFAAYQLIVYAIAIWVVVLIVPHGVAGLLALLGKGRRAPTSAKQPARIAVPLPAAGAAVLKPGTTLFKAVEVSKRFGGVRALDSVDLTIAEHEIKALIGPNGSGKTTLFNCITGIDPADSGTLRFDDRDVGRLTAHRIARCGIARSFQIVQLFGRMTVYENVLVAGQRQHPSSWLASLFGLAESARADAANAADADKLLAQAGLLGERDQLAMTLPYGRQRLLEIARALATRPKLLLLDEPAAGLNTGEAQELARYLRAVRASGVTILLVEHNMPFVLGLADSVAVLNHGRKIADGPPATVQRDEAVIAAYLGAPSKEDAA